MHFSKCVEHKIIEQKKRHLWRNDEGIVEPALLGCVDVEKAALQAGPAGRNRFCDGGEVGALLRAALLQVVDTPVVHAGIQDPVDCPQVGAEVASPANHLPQRKE